MSRAILVLALIAVVAGAVGLTAPGEGGERAGRLVWARAGHLVRPPGLPADRLLTGEVRNDGLRPLRLVAAEVRVVDDRGRMLPTAASFALAYAPGARTRALTLAPGRTAPLTVAWRGAGARRVAIGAARLPLPR